MLKTLFDIYLTTPEQGLFVLSIIVNKLGDSDKKVSSEALFSLQQIARKKVQHIESVILEVDRFLSRPNLSEKSKYYAMLFLNHVVFNNSQNGKHIAKNVVRVYFRFFDSLIEKDQTDTKVLDSLLTGIHRAFPFADLTAEE